MRLPFHHPARRFQNEQALWIHFYHVLGFFFGDLKKQMDVNLKGNYGNYTNTFKQIPIHNECQQLSCFSLVGSEFLFKKFQKVT
mmetsp:Transcript_16970/g.24635  ORF Transcript_16970/g.24635 Transcript_16970/m.24635 type:complete len:84 (+) Transcript_16970:812-1063(+)